MQLDLPAFRRPYPPPHKIRIEQARLSDHCRVSKIKKVNRPIKLFRASNRPLWKPYICWGEVGGGLSPPSRVKGRRGQVMTCRGQGRKMEEGRGLQRSHPKQSTKIAPICGVLETTPYPKVGTHSPQRWEEVMTIPPTPQRTRSTFSTKFST